jgi:nucleoside-diphosphate-sugar epimerase
LAFSPSLAQALADSGLHVVITGAGGWIGQATLEMIEGALGDQFSVRVHAYGSARRVLRLRSGNTLVSESLGQLRDLKSTPRLVAHLAFVTREHVGSHELLEYESLNEAIASTVLDHVHRGDVEGVFVPSSGAVYNLEGRPEADLRTNPYGLMKLRDEERFGNASPRAGRTAIVRVFNLAGAFLNKANAYALGSILTDLAAGGPISLRADHPVIRSYTHVGDLVELAFAVMLGSVAGPGAPFDTEGEREIEIGDLATLSASLVGLPRTPIERPPFAGTAAPDRYVGDGTEMRRLAVECRRDLATLEDQILDTAEFLWARGPDLPDSPGG